MAEGVLKDADIPAILGRQDGIENQVYLIRLPLGETENQVYLIDLYRPAILGAKMG